MKTKRVMVMVRPDVWQKIRHIALDRGISASELIRQLIELFLQKA